MPSAAPFLFTHFDRLAEAPSGIAKLRALILRLAVEGKLVEAGTREIALVPLGDLCESRSGNGKMIKGTLSDLPGEGMFPCFSASGQDVWHDQYEHDGDAVIVSAVGARCGKTFVATGKWSAIANTHILFPKTGCSLSYLHLITNNEGLWIRGGSAQPFVKVASTRRERLVYFPPLAEQRRIVTKVEELMGLCAALEAAQQERETVRTRLRTSALHQLTSPDSDSNSAAFFLQNLQILTGTSDDLTSFRDLVSLMAVEGDLSSEGAASWATDKFENVVELQGGVTKGRNLIGEKTVELPYLRVANVQRGHLELDVMKMIEIRERESEKYALRAGDLVITEGGDWDKVGRTAVWREEIKPCIHQNHIFRARPDPKRLLPEWGMLALNSRKGRDYFADASKQTTNLASINMSQLRRFPIPLPPLAEQRRIIAKVDELMAVLAALEATLTTARTTSENLLAATVARLHAA